jgi:hypothetical protein
MTAVDLITSLRRRHEAIVNQDCSRTFSSGFC